VSYCEIVFTFFLF